MRPHENLNVWKEAVDFVAEVYEGTEHFRKKSDLALRNMVSKVTSSTPSSKTTS